MTQIVPLRVRVEVAEAVGLPRPGNGGAATTWRTGGSISSQRRSRAEGLKRYGKGR